MSIISSELSNRTYMAFHSVLGLRMLGQIDFSIKLTILYKNCKNLCHHLVGGEFQSKKVVKTLVFTQIWVDVVYLVCSCNDKNVVGFLMKMIFTSVSIFLLERSI